MGTAAPVQCERCAKTTDVELKDVAVDEKGLSVSFDFTCSHCGLNRAYRSLPPSQAGGILGKVNEAEEMARLTGLSVEKVKAYVYPPDVMAQADLERRKIASVSVKSELKMSRQPFPAEQAGWWKVYVLSSRQLEIWFAPSTREYRLVETGGGHERVADVVHLGELLFQRFSIAT